MRIGKYKVKKRFFVILTILLVALILSLVKCTAPLRDKSVKVKKDLVETHKFYSETYYDAEKKFNLYYYEEKNPEKWAVYFKEKVKELNAFNKPFLKGEVPEELESSKDAAMEVKSTFKSLLEAYNAKFLTDIKQDEQTEKIKKLQTEILYSLDFIETRLKIHEKEPIIEENFTEEE